MSSLSPDFSQKRVLCLDVGEKRIGVAISDPLGIIAQPLTTLERKGEKEDIEAILSLVRQYDVRLVLVGFPRSLNGSLGKEAMRVQGFVCLLKEANLIVETWDERLSTVEAEKRLREIRVKEKGKRDALAAALVLQSFLEQRRSLPSV